MATTTRTIDPELLTLRGTVFDQLPALPSALIDVFPCAQASLAASLRSGGRGRRAARIAGGIAIAMMAGGVACAAQMLGATGMSTGSRATAATLLPAPAAGLAAADALAAAPERAVAPAIAADPIAAAAATAPAVAAPETAAPAREAPAVAAPKAAPAPVVARAIAAVPAPAAVAAPAAPEAAEPPRPAVDAAPAIAAAAPADPTPAPEAALSELEPNRNAVEALAAPPVEFNRAAAATAIAVAARRAQGCLEADDARTGASVRVTFAPSGRVTTATINGGPFTGTEVGSCIARALRDATIGPFEGAAVAISTSIRLR